VESSVANLRSLFDRLPDPVAVHRDGLIVYANAKMLSATGYERVEDFVGRSLLEFVHPEERESVRDRLRETDREGARSRERRIVARDGTIRIVEVTALPLVFEGEIAYVAICHDVTERKRMEERLANAERLALIGRLAAAVGHEINNPLAFMLGSLELARNELGTSTVSVERDARITRHLAAVRDGAERVRDIVRDLRSLSITPEDALSAVDVERVLDLAVAATEQTLEPRARLVKAYGRVPRACSNPGRLRQVFVNLLLNAAQAIPEGDPGGNEIRLTTLSQVGSVVIEISDTGSGIAAEHTSRIFEPFFTTKAPGAGTGLGLPISRAIITAHGGTLEAENLAPGSLFRVTLRAAPDAESTATSEPASRPGGQRARVLVVDDELLTTRVLTELLAPHDVSVATSGREAIALMQQDTAFDVIVCDLQMSHGTGMDVYAYLQQHAPQLARRMIFMTGGALTPQAHDFLARCQQPVLEKPFDPARLTHLVSELCR
jgi:two-component system, cell cycle sensor histidine kinase and response regulator CckA